MLLGVGIIGIMLSSCTGNSTRTTVFTFSVAPTDWVSAGGPAGSPDNGFKYTLSSADVTLDVLNQGEVSVQLFYPVPINEFVDLPLIAPYGSTCIKYGYLEGQIYIIVYDLDLDATAPSSTMNFKAIVTTPI